MTSQERKEVQNLCLKAYEKGFSIGFDIGYGKCINDMEALIKKEDKHGAENEQNRESTD